MTPPELAALQSDAFIDRFFAIGTAEALRGALARSPEVLAVRDAMKKCSLDESSVAHFVADLLNSFERGTLFRHDLTLAALAVAVEATFSPQVDLFLDRLARLRIAEIPMASRVARLVQRDRSLQPSLTVKSVRSFALECLEQMKVLEPLDCSGLPPATRRIQKTPSTAPEVIHADA